MSQSHQTLYSSQCVFKDKRLHDHVFFFHSDTFYGQRLLSFINNDKVHLHLIIQYVKIRTFSDPIRENIGRSRGTNKDAHWMNLLDVE